MGQADDHPNPELRRPGAEALNEMMWAAGCQAALADAKALEAFARDTGRPMATAGTAIAAAAIDEATGGARVEVGTFVDWWTRKVWGAEWAPRKWIEAQTAQGLSDDPR